MPQPRLHTAMFHRSAQGHQVPTHQHQQHELVLVLRGRLRVRCPGAVLAGTAGSLHVFPAGCAHDQGCSGPWQTICALFHGDDAVLAGGPQAIDSSGDVMLPSWFHQLCELARCRTAEDAATADALLQAVLHRLRRLQRGHSELAGRPPALSAALERVEAQLDRDLDVAALATAVGLSRSHLGELFRQHLGCSPKRHHTRLRLDRAKALLANPYASVSTVAHELGFTDANWFVRRFRAEHGIPPGRWRDGSLSLSSPTPVPTA